jgi:hypothetical protein
MLLAFRASAVLEHTSLTEEEHSQIVQTIEMFEVIIQTQPDDYQSLEILKDAYTKVGQPEESLRIERKLAEAYFSVGSYTLAMQECEVILLKEPNSPEILAMLGEIESRLQAAGHSLVEAGPKSGLIEVPHLNGTNGHSNGHSSNGAPAGRSPDRSESPRRTPAGTRGRPSGEVFDHAAALPGGRGESRPRSGEPNEPRS